MALVNDPQQGGPRYSLRTAFRWASPSRDTWDKASPLSEADWRSQHDEISKTIWKLTSVLVGSSLFCLFVLGAPDASLVSTDAKVTIPIASITASYADFLFFGPIFLIGVVLYLHVFIELRLRMGYPVSAEPAAQTQPLSPFIFNLPLSSANVLSMFLFYGMLPCVLAFFVWKAIPRPEAAWPLLFVFVAMSGVLIALKIRRFGAESRATAILPSSIRLGGLWVLLAICFMAVFPLAWLAAQTGFAQLHLSQDSAAQPSAATGFRDSPLLRIRRLQLFGAALDKKNLSGFYGPYADLRKSDLQDTDLEGANLMHADLRKANLTGANLTGSDLRFAHLDGADLTKVKFDHADLRGVTIDDQTVIDIKWRRVICVVDGNVSKDCLQRQDLTWTNLAGANLGRSDLHGQQMTGADLSYADLSQTNLTGTILRGTDLRHAQLPPSIRAAVLDGALATHQQGLPEMGRDTVVSLKNRATGACLEGALVPDSGSHPTMAYPCAPANDRLGAWTLKRLANGSFVFGSTRPNRPTCLDGTTFTEGAQLQMWECNDDYENQYWRLTPLTGGFVHMEKNQTGFCLDGTGSRDHSPIPILTKCDKDDHSQHWEITFPQVPASQQAALLGDQLRKKREQDLNRAITQYAVSPLSPVYGSRIPYGSRGYRTGLRYGRPMPNRYGYRPGPGR